MNEKKLAITSPKFIFITGGVVSSLGKGLASAALGALLQARGFKVRLRKLDPYLNVDPGTMSPTQHGEVFVTDDGAETDLDLGHYERFTGIHNKKGDSVTTGKIYSDLLQKERRGDYLGMTVQVIPHVTDLIKDFIRKNTENEEFVLCEIGGTVGDIEALPFFEAIRQFGNDMPNGDVIYVHLTLVPYVEAAKETKTKPTQHSVKELRSIGIQPNILLCRANEPISESDKNKIALFCNLRKESVISAPDVSNIYEVPIIYHENGLDSEVLNAFGIQDAPDADLSKWYWINKKIRESKKEINIAIVGKYVALTDAYKSVIEALEHGAIANDCKVNVCWIDARNVIENKEELISKIDGILVPGGFGETGIDGKIEMINFARINGIPFFGICLGMQLMVVEIARNLCGIEGASSAEFGPCKRAVVALMNEWNGQNGLHKQDKENLGGTMRLGSFEACLKEGSLAREIYGTEKIQERHRHRFEVDVTLAEEFEKIGAVFSGISPDGKLPEILELERNGKNAHPWFLGVQFHPELKSKPFDAHKLFKSFVGAALEFNLKKGEKND